MATPKILILDDDFEFAGMMAAACGALGHETHVETSSTAALALIGATPSLQLVFIDLSLSGQENGFDLADRVAAQRPDLSIALMSGFGSYSDRPARYADTEVLTKPLSLKDLGAFLARKLT
ncbi:response regulator [Tropicibacter sp. S64]|uniref:response regulator n=1 Tax=Tropicibacter sp. S64 TaxID=3415122 RepID=UPI003C7E35E7